MKNYLLFAVALLLGLGAVSCEKGLRTVDPGPGLECWIFVTTTSDPVILLAKSRLSPKDAFVIAESFETQYGNENVCYGYEYPVDWPQARTDAIPNCYEITMTVKFEESSVPSVKSLFDYGFQGVKIVGTTAICKLYLWASTEPGEGKLIPLCEVLWDGRKSYYGNGNLVAISMKKLGPEVHGKPIIF